MPRVHNRDAPVACRPVHWRSQYSSYVKHAAALDRVKPRIDNKWGATWNGVQEQKRSTYPHVRSNLKRAQLQDERFQAIELENYMLLGKLSKILERSHNPTHGTREWGNGVRLTSNQVPVIDHCVPQHTNEFGAAIEPTSLNIRIRQKQQDEIAVENLRLLRRLVESRPTYDRAALDRDWQERKRYLRNQQFAHRPIVIGDGGSGVSRLRPASAAASLARRSSTSSTSTNLVPPRRPDRPRSAMPRGPSARPQPVEKSVIKVLELLSSQMKDARSLAQVRLSGPHDKGYSYPIWEQTILCLVSCHYLDFNCRFIEKN